MFVLLFLPHYFTDEEEESLRNSSRFIHADAIVNGDREIDKGHKVPNLLSLSLIWRRTTCIVLWRMGNGKVKNRVRRKGNPRFPISFMLSRKASQYIWTEPWEYGLPWWLRE